MKSFLMILNKDWADEFNTYGMKLYSEEEYTRLISALESVKNFYQEWEFGTNEFHEATIEDYLLETETVVLNEKKANVLKDIFPNIDTWGVGLCSDISELIDNFEDEEDIDTPQVREYWRYINDKHSS